MKALDLPNPFATRPRGHVAALDVSNEEYHGQCDGISNSMLSVFLDDPALFEGYYISRRWKRPAPSADMVFGSMCHEVILEDGLERLVEIPSSVLAKDGSRRGAAWHVFETENAGKTLLKPEEIKPLREIRRNCEVHPIASQLLYESDGQTEYSLEWTEPATGLLLRARLDRLIRPHGRWPALIVDVKTCQRTDPKSFAESCWRYGYHRQAAFYRAGVEALLGERPPFVFVAVRKTPPYSVACYELSEEFMEAGDNEVASALLALANCRDTGCWAAETAAQILTLDAPRWSKFDSEWEAT